MSHHHELRRFLLAALGVGACGGMSVGTEISQGGPDASSPPPDASTETTDVVVAPDAVLDALPPVPNCRQRSGQCFSPEAMITMWNSPIGRNPDVIDAGPPPVDPNGCLPAVHTRDGCCIQASAGPNFSGTECCYVFCGGACCGRPFVVGGEVRVADARVASHFSDGGGFSMAPPQDERTRDAVAQAWLLDAQMEHASIAAFARFTLELLAVGAPASLVADCQSAALDEVRHAKKTFALASHLLGREVGPAPLSVSGLELTISLEELAAAAFRDGCVGETLAALLAMRQAEVSAVPEVAAFLRDLAREESNHAALAYRFVAWAVTQGGEGIRARIRTEALALVAERFVRPLPEGTNQKEAEAWGRLSGGEILRVVSLGLREVVRPCAETLCEVAPFITV